MEAYEPDTYRIGECSDERAHMRRLARAFAVRIRKVWISSAGALKENFAQMR